MPRGAKPKFTPSQDAEIASLYVAGKTLEEIAESFGASTTPVRAALKRSGIRIRPSGKKRTGWDDTPGQRAAVIAAYEGGESIEAIARRLKIRDQVITDCLNDAGIPRKHPGGRPMFSPEVAQAIATAYQGGMSLTAIARQRGTNARTIANYLDRAGIARRKSGPPKFWTDEREAEATRRYQAGESQEQIAQALGCDQTSVSYALLRLRVRSRTGKRRSANARWKGGRVIDGHGYVRVKLPDAERHLAKPMANEYVLEHRLVMARAIGRPLRDDESVHHINGDKLDNRLENLQLRNGHHGKGVRVVCLDCGSHNIGHIPLS